MWSQKRKGKNGRFRYVWTERFKDPRTGKYKTVSVTLDGKTKRYEDQARHILDEKIRSALNTCSEGNMLFGELCDRYIEYQKAVNKPGTASSTEYALRTLRLIIGEDTLIRTLNGSICRDLIMQHDPSNITRNQRIKTLRKTLRYASERDWMEEIKIPKFSEPSPAIKNANKYLTRDEIYALIHSMKIAQWRCLSYFLALSGCRPGEAIVLYMDGPMKDIDLENRTIRICRTWSLSAKQLHSSPKEDNSYRYIWITDEALPIIKDIIRYQYYIQEKEGYHSDLLFSDPRKGKYEVPHLIHYDAYAKYFRECVYRLFPERAIPKNGIKQPCSPYILRHSFSSYYASQGVPSEIVARTMGHSPVTNKNIYTHRTPDTWEHDKDIMNSIRYLT